MRLIISNYRAIQSATIDLQGITVVYGKNGAGKSSLSEAFRMLLLQDANLYSLTKEEGRGLITDGEDIGDIELIDGEKGKIRIMLPERKINTDRNPPFASPIATGKSRFLELHPKQQVECLTLALKANPNETDLQLALKHLFSDEGTIQKVWKLLDKEGWDATAKRYAEMATEAKGEWRGATGETWGEKKGAEYHLRMQDDQWIGEKQDELMKLNDRLTIALKSSGATEEKRAQLKAKADQVDSITANIESQEKAIAASSAELNKAHVDRDALPSWLRTQTETGIPCPSCQKPLVIEKIKGGTQLIVAPEQPADNAKNKAMRMQLASLDGAIGRLPAAIDSAKAALVETRRQLRETVEAKQALADMERSTSAEDPVAVTKLLEEGKAELAEALKKKGARDAHNKVTRYVEVSRILGSNGLRSDVMKKKLAEFQATLDRYCSSFGTPRLTLDENMTIRYDGRLTPFISESERFRANVLIQLAVADSDGSETVIIDGADVIVGKDRGGLLQALVAFGKPSLVTIAIPSKDRAIPLPAEFGKAWFIEQGKLEEIG